MALLMLLGYLMCNVLLAWATLQQPYLSKSLSSPPPKNPNKWMHSVIFEPQPQIQLTHSSYKVTSFLSFQPFLQGFLNVKNYIDQLWADIWDPFYYEYLFIPIVQHMPIDPSIHNSHIATFKNSCLCIQCPYECQTKLKFEKFKKEVQYIIQVFHAIYRKFLVAIDHLEFHPSQAPAIVTRLKRIVMCDTYRYYHTPTKTLTPSEENFLNAFIDALNKINPLLHKNLSCMKRMGIFTWILGWGVYSNARNITKIKENLHILQKQNQLQDKQIKLLAKFLNLTMHQVDWHSEMLYELDTKMTIMNKTIQQVMWSIDVIQFESALMQFFQNKSY